MYRLIFRLRIGHCRLNSHLKRTGVKDLCSMPLWRGGPNTRTLPTVLLTPSASKAADMAHLCIPQKHALGDCRGFVPDIQVCGSHGREDLVKETITLNAEEEEGVLCLLNFPAWTDLLRQAVHSATLGQKLQIKFAISHKHRTLRSSQPVPSLIL